MSFGDRIYLTPIPPTGRAGLMMRSYREDSQSLFKLD